MKSTKHGHRSTTYYSPTSTAIKKWKSLPENDTWPTTEKTPELKTPAASEGKMVGFGQQSNIVDIDKDGDLDIVAPGKSGLYMFENLMKGKH